MWHSDTSIDNLIMMGDSEIQTSDLFHISVLQDFVDLVLTQTFVLFAGRHTN